MKRIALSITKKRYELLAKAEAYLIENQPIIPLDTPSVNWLKKPYVKGMYPNPVHCIPGSMFTSNAIRPSGITARRVWTQSSARCNAISD